MLGKIPAWSLTGLATKYSCCLLLFLGWPTRKFVYIFLGLKHKWSNLYCLITISLWLEQNFDCHEDFDCHLEQEHILELVGSTSRHKIILQSPLDFLPSSSLTILNFFYLKTNFTLISLKDIPLFLMPWNWTDATDDQTLPESHLIVPVK